MRRWACYRCERTFLHGRYLVAHLIGVHNERPAA